MTAYEDLGKAFAQYEQASELYDKVRHFSEVPEVAAGLVHEEGDEVMAAMLRDPKTPMEKKAEALNIFGVRKAGKKLEELVGNKFDQILNDAPRDALDAALLNYDPREDVKGDYKRLRDAHKVLINLSSFANRKRLKDPNVGEGVLESMKEDVREHYEKLYKPGKDDSDEVREDKELIKRFFLGLLETNEDGRYIVAKYQAIHSEKVKEFNEAISNKSKLVDYIKATLPEDKKSRLSFLKVLALAGAKKRQD